MLQMIEKGTATACTKDTAKCAGFMVLAGERSSMHEFIVTEAAKLKTMLADDSAKYQMTGIQATVQNCAVNEPQNHSSRGHASASD